MIFNLFNSNPAAVALALDEEALLPRGRCAGFLVIDHLRHSYGPLPALDDVSLTVAPGEILCLLGASGCGKSTLLRLIAGVEQPASGRILLDGREVCGPSAFVPPEQRGVGLVFQDYALFPHLSVAENVMFGLSHLPKAHARALAMRALARVSLARYADDYPHQISGGEQQRVALARALAPRPSVLLMDEPFSNLDQRLRESIREQTVALLRDEGMSAVIVTHDPEEAMQLADSIALMEAGRIVQTGTPEQLYNHPQTLFALRFFCDVNEIGAVCVDGEISSPLGRFPAPSALADGPCVVCIRPQDIAVQDSLQAAPKAEQNSDRNGCVVAEFVSKQFLGHDDRLRFRVNGLAQDLYVRTSHTAPLKAGQVVRLDIDPARVTSFAC